jgi:hypothetical protein
MPPAEAARNDVDHNVQIQLPADLAQQVQIDRFRISIIAVGAPPAGFRAGLIVGRGADQFQDLLADPMHIDGQGDAAVTDQGQAKFFLPHEAAYLS